MQCWNCNENINNKDAYSIHIMNETVKCIKCNGLNNRKSISVNNFIKQYNIDKTKLLLYNKKLHFYPKSIYNKYSKFKDLFKFIKKYIGKEFNQVDNRYLFSAAQKYKDNMFGNNSLVKF
jgi:excinuclease UvrABC ATPase subunit